MLSKESQAEAYLIQMIISHVLKPGENLLPERILAENLNYSRPVIHKAIIRLEEKGFLKIKPRKGVVVMDYKEHGKLSALDSIFNFEKAGINMKLNHDMIAFIRDNFKSIVICFKTCKKIKTNYDLTEEEHYLLWLKDYARQSNNRLYVMLMNEFEVGINNVSKYLVANHWVQSQFYRIDDLIVCGKIDDAINLIDPLFKKIENLWLGGTHVI